MKDSPLATQTMQFSVSVVELIKELNSRNEYILSKQILRSGTSIGANVSEANYAQSKADFVSKLQIALKESNETLYWLELLYRTEYINETIYSDLSRQCKSIRSMLVKSINTAKSTLL